jgi:hypothetical protein
MIIVGKHINGVVLNPLEYILDENGWLKKFADKTAAAAFLKEHGADDEAIEELVFEEYKPLKIGKYVPASNDTAEIIEREFYEQGDIFKDEEAYEAGLDKVCYIAELSDDKYTRQDFLDLCDNQEILARGLFDRLDWQHPGSQLQDEYSSGAFHDCENKKCGRMFAYNESYECPHCNTSYEPDEFM